MTKPSTPHRNRLSRLPPWLSRWFGYRTSHSPGPLWEICIWSFVGAFCGIALIQAVFGQAHYFIRRSVPPIIASYGASTILIYGSIEVPLSQPRALLGGHFLGALTGVCVTKLFGLLPTEKRFQDLLWLCGSLACASSVVVMEVTGTTHPPAGATALLAAVNPAVRDLGWYFLPVVLLSSTLALSVALIINNIRRRYPTFWFKPDSDSPTAAGIAVPSTLSLGGDTIVPDTSSEKPPDEKTEVGATLV